MRRIVPPLMAGALLVFGVACDDNEKGGAQNEKIDEDDTRVGPAMARTRSDRAGSDASEESMATFPYRRVTTIGPPTCRSPTGGSHSPLIPTPASASASRSRWPVSILGGVSATRA